MAAVAYVMEEHLVTERRACRALSVNRTAYRYEPVRLPDEDEVRAEIIYMACNFGRVGYRMVSHMMRNNGTKINHKRVERIWREEGLKLPKKQVKKRRLWMHDGSCKRLRPKYRNHVWSYDFVEDKTYNGKKLRFLNIIDEYSKECIASMPSRSWRDNDLIEVLLDGW
jgi:putative transposase